MAFRRVGRRLILISSDKDTSSFHSEQVHVPSNVQSSLKRHLDNDEKKKRKATSRRAALISPLLMEDRVDAKSESNLLPCIPDFDEEDISDEECGSRPQPTNQLQLVCLHKKKKRNKKSRNTYGGRRGVVTKEVTATEKPFQPKDDCLATEQLVLATAKEPQTKDDDENDLRIKAAASVLLLMRYVTALEPHLPTMAVPSNLMEANTNDAPIIAILPSPASQPKAMRLTQPEDRLELNSLHCFVRSHLLEVFVKQDVASTEGSLGGQVGLRCVYCTQIPRKDRMTMSSFYPKSLKDIYRFVCTWQRVHFQTCKYIPTRVRQTYDSMKTDDKSRGRTRYWTESAVRLGLEDIGEGEREGIRFRVVPTV